MSRPPLASLLQKSLESHIVTMWRKGRGGTLDPLVALMNGRARRSVMYTPQPGPGQIRCEYMSTKLKVGDHVRWNSEAGYVSGRIIKVHTRDTLYKGHPRHASRGEPQYEIKSDKTDHIALHKGSVLRKIH